MSKAEQPAPSQQPASPARLVPSVTRERVPEASSEPEGRAELAATGAEPPATGAEPPATGAEPPAGPAERTEYEIEVPESQATVSEEEELEGQPSPVLVELGLSEVRLSVLLRPGQEAGLVVLAEMDEPFRSLHIYVGQAEAKAIQVGWHGGRPARPSTWDLLLQAVELLGGRVERVVIDKVEEARHFFATVELERAGETFSLSCRPSDAIALAVRTAGAGLYTTEDVLAAAGQYP
jgi:bifunctional DNase/RNase